MLEDLMKPTHLLILLVIVLLLFGAKRLPELAKAVGKSVKILKTEVIDLHDDDQPDGTADNAAPTAKPASPSHPADTAEHHQV
jgi:sec-independent protein translocase protein TatA